MVHTQRCLQTREAGRIDVAVVLKPAHTEILHLIQTLLSIIALQQASLASIASS